MHVLVTAGPTREYLDDVRFLSNASSGRMGYAVARAALGRGWRVTLVTGPVALSPPPGAEVRQVVSARDMLDACLELLPQMDGFVAVAAVSDYRPAHRVPGKIHRTTESIHLECVPNPDILAEIGRRKTSRQWTVGFAVESADLLERARTKLTQKCCDAIVVNAAHVIDAADTHIQLLDRTSSVALEVRGSKEHAAERIIAWISEHLCGV